MNSITHDKNETSLCAAHGVGWACHVIQQTTRGKEPSRAVSPEPEISYLSLGDGSPQALSWLAEWSPQCLSARFPEYSITRAEMEWCFSEGSRT